MDLVSSDQYGNALICLIALTAPGVFLGIAANFLNLLVFVRMRLKDSVLLSFFVLSVSDLCISVVFLVIVAVAVLKVLVIKTNVVVTVEPQALLVIGALFNETFILLSTLVTCYLAVSKSMCVILPFKFKLYFTPFRTSIILCVITVLCLGHMGFFSQITLVWKAKGDNSSQLALKYKSYHYHVLSVVDSIRGLIVTIGSECITLVSVILMIVKLKQSMRFRQRHKKVSHQVVLRRRSCLDSDTMRTSEGQRKSHITFTNDKTTQGQDAAALRCGMRCDNETSASHTDELTEQTQKSTTDNQKTGLNSNLEKTATEKQDKNTTKSQKADPTEIEDQTANSKETGSNDNQKTGFNSNFENTATDKQDENTTKGQKADPTEIEDQTANAKETGRNKKAEQNMRVNRDNEGMSVGLQRKRDDQTDRAEVDQNDQRLPKNTKTSENTREKRLIQQVTLVAGMFVIFKLPAVAIVLLRYFDGNFRGSGIYPKAAAIMAGSRFLSETWCSAINIFIYYHYNSKYKATLRQLLGLYTAKED